MTPIIYEGNIDVRFSDLDPYGHVNAKHYLDYVGSTRFQFMEQRLNMPNSEILKRGFKFYMRKSQFEYLKPVEGCVKLYVRSFISHARGPRHTVSFEIQDAEKQTTFCQGSFEFILVNQEDKLVRNAPDWMKELFFTQENQDNRHRDFIKKHISQENSASI